MTQFPPNFYEFYEHHLQVDTRTVMDILSNVQKAVKDTIKTLESAGGGGQSDDSAALPKFRTHQSRPPNNVTMAKGGKTQMKRPSPKVNPARSEAKPLAEDWKPAKVGGAIYGNKILHFKDPIATTGPRKARSSEWVLEHFFNTGEAICRFCFKMASGANGVVFVVSDGCRGRHGSSRC